MKNDNKNVPRQGLAAGAGKASRWEARITQPPSIKPNPVDPVNTKPLDCVGLLLASTAIFNSGVDPEQVKLTKDGRLVHVPEGDVCDCGEAAQTEDGFCSDKHALLHYGAGEEF